MLAFGVALVELDSEVAADNEFDLEDFEGFIEEDQRLVVVPVFHVQRSHQLQMERASRH